MTGTTKGEWHRPHNKKKFDDGYELAFGKKEKRARYVSVRKQKKGKAA